MLCYVTLCYIMFCSVLLYSTLLYSILFCSICYGLPVDHAPLNLKEVAEASLLRKVGILRSNMHLVKAGQVLGPVAGPFYELMTAPTTKAHDSRILRQ
jgi:hypothetical protein